MKETDFARYLTRFLSVYLPGQVGSKRNTQLAYRDSFSLFLMLSGKLIAASVCKLKLTF